MLGELTFDGTNNFTSLALSNSSVGTFENRYGTHVINASGFVTVKLDSLFGVGSDEGTLEPCCSIFFAPFA